MSNKAYDVQVDAVQFYDDRMIVEWYGAVGFGQITLYKDKKGNFKIDAEYMSPEFIMIVLSKLVDKAIIK